MTNHPDEELYSVCKTEEEFLTLFKHILNTTKELPAMPEHRVKPGHNIEHISRVTGYFSIIGRWNKGKQAELKDRFRTSI